MSGRAIRPLAILLVEDQEDVAQSTAELLSLAGHAVRIAASGPVALRELTEQMPDVVLLDIGLPALSGWEVAQQLRHWTVEKQPIVIAVTARGSESDRLKSADAGIDLHLIKPVNPASLNTLLWRISESLSGVQSKPDPTACPPA